MFAERSALDFTFSPAGDAPLPAGTVVNAYEQSTSTWLAAFTVGSYTVRSAGPERTFTGANVSVRHSDYHFLSSRDSSDGPTIDNPTASGMAWSLLNASGGRTFYNVRFRAARRL